LRADRARGRVAAEPARPIGFLLPFAASTHILSLPGAARFP